MSKERKKGQKTNSIRTGNSFLDAMSRYAEIAKAQRDKALENPDLTDRQRQEAIAQANARIGFAFNTSLREVSGMLSKANNREVGS